MPLNTVRVPKGIAASIFLRLLARAPNTRSQPTAASAAGSARRAPREGCGMGLRKALPVTLAGFS